MAQIPRADIFGEATPQEKVAAFKDLEVRKRLRLEAVEGVDVAFDAFSRRWDHFKVTKPALEKNQNLKGKSIAQIAQEQGKDVLDAFLDLALEENLETGFELNQSGGDEKAMAELLTSPYTVIGLSDGGAHVVFDAGFGYSTHFLGHWVREKQIMPLEEAVRKLTFVSASLFGMYDRGLLRPGMAAAPSGTSMRSAASTRSGARSWKPSTWRGAIRSWPSIPRRRAAG